MRETALGAYAHQDVPFEKLVEELEPERDLGRSPLFQVMLNFLENAPQESLAQPGLTFRNLPGERATAHFDLTLTLGFEGDRLAGDLNYTTDLFDRSTMARLVRQLENLLAHAAADESAPLSALPLLAAPERHQLVAEWNQSPEPPASAPLLHQPALARAAELPERIAIESADEQWTYAHLAARAADWAARLQPLDLGPEARVGVMLDRRPELVAALLGILQAGAAYVPLDPGYPAERLAFLVEDSNVAAVIVEDHHADKLPASDLVLLSPADAGRGEAVSGPAPSPDGLAYLIYTSGSTGRPKGVAIRHRSAVAFLDWAATAFSAHELSGVLASTSINFDLSVFELFVPLAQGGRILLAANALALPELPARERVTLLNTVPSALAGLLEGELPASLTTLNLAGEALPAELVHDAYQRPGVGRVLNLYGPSEDTTYSTYTLVPRGERRVTVGRPLPGTAAFVVGRTGAPMPAGVPGELLLAGRGLARGYLGRPGLTAERFVPDAWSGEPGARAYRTGDRARFLADGEIEFLGRLDFQVKLRGFRIELGEIEAALLAQPGIRQAVALVREDLPGGRGLVAYVVAAPLTLALSPPAGRGDQNASLPAPSHHDTAESAASPAPSPRDSGERAGVRGADLRDALRQRLPDYMVPAAVTFLDALPLSPSGKVDRKALAARAAPATATAALSAPASPLEELVAGVFAGLLGLAEAGRESHFFALGGHSLLATQLVSRLREAFGVELPVRAVFEAPTVAALAARLDEVRRGATPSAVAPPLTRSEHRGPEEISFAPLSFAQERLWFLDQLDPGSGTYNIPAALVIGAGLDVRALGQAFSAVVGRHESLRTTFATVDGRPVQVISPPAAFPLPVVDLGALHSAGEAELRRLAQRYAGRAFDLEAGPLLRSALVRLAPAAEGAPAEHGLLLSMHHIVSDGWSMGVLLREVSALYAASPRG